MIDTTYHIIENTKDSVAAFTTGYNEGTIGTEVDITVQLIWSAVAMVIGAVIGALVTLKTKKKEFENFQENLNLQKQIFQETKDNNENWIKAEKVKLQDLRRNYQLSLKKFDFQHLNKVLEFADDKDDRAQMLKDFVKVLAKYNPDPPDYVRHINEYEQFIAQSLFYKLDDLKKDVSLLLSKYPSTYLSFHNDFKKIKSEAGYLLGSTLDCSIQFDDPDDEFLIEQLSNGLVKLHKKLNDLYGNMQDEFASIDKIRRSFIASQMATK